MTKPGPGFSPDSWRVSRRRPTYEVSPGVSYKREIRLSAPLAVWTYSTRPPSAFAIAWSRSL